LFYFSEEDFIMTQSTYPNGRGGKRSMFDPLLEKASNMPRQLVIGVILVLALFAFEMFNFDTTRFALESLLGDVQFVGLAWATILAIAFCAIDFAGLARLFTPERGRNEPKEIWYLTGAWLLGATMNAVMTWWAVSMTLLNNPIGNEVMSREQLIKIVPVFVAVLVWLTRILFIGAISMAGERLLHGDGASKARRHSANDGAVPGGASGAKGQSKGRKQPATSPQPQPAPVAATATTAGNAKNSGRVRHGPPRPFKNVGRRPQTNGATASSRRTR
jgi:hypothetical protein